MDMPATVTLGAAARPAQRFPALLRKSISAHGIFLALITAYYAGFMVLLHMRPDFDRAACLRVLPQYHRDWR